ncbi:MAG: disulfide bond formation protein B [Planctomycetes bacterium]|nr:disulfide bond formation protein B [Planctomycetota bacterium]
MSVSTAHTHGGVSEEERIAVLPWAALVVSLAALGGSVFLSLGLNLKACPLCFYQRTFVMSLVAVLGTGLVLHGGRGIRIGLLALPLATAGLGVALFHEFLELKGTLECPLGVFGIGTAPKQSLAMFVVLFAILAVDVLRREASWVAFSGALLIGGLLAVASCTTNPPMPPPPSQPHPSEPEICRPPYCAPK